MEKVHKVIVGFFVAVIIIIAILFFISIKKENNYYTCTQTLGLPSEAVLYYGDTCPHCKIVEDFLTENDVASRLDFVQKEVYRNNTNAQELLLIGSLCRLPSNYVGSVPLFYMDGKAFLGDKPIIEFLNNTYFN